MANMIAGPHRSPRLQPRAALYVLVLAAATLIAYLPALGAGYIWDDDFYVTANRTLRDVEGLRRIWIEPGATPQYYPLVFTSFWIEHAIWGLRPFGYHLVNVLLHIGNALLLVAVLRRLGVAGGWLAGLLFALHPVQVESVAWITERKNTLSLLLALLALLAYLRFMPLDGQARAPRRWAWYLASLALFAAALLSKTVTCSLPAAILVVTWWKRGRVALRDVLALVPFFLLGIALAWVTVTMERSHVGAEALNIDLSPLERVLLAGRALWFYLSKLVAPFQLVFIYPQWVVDDRIAWQYVFPIAAAALVLVLWLLRKRIGRGPLAAAVLYGGILLPALGFIDVYPFRYSWVADHFQYHASAAALTLLAALIAGGIAHRMAWRSVAGLALGATLALLTYRQSGMYRNIETLWLETIARNPACWMAYTNLGNLHVRENRFAEALPYIQRALELKPEHPLALNALANMALHERRFAEALDYCQRALRSPEPPRAEIYNNLGLAHQGLNNADAAVAAFRRAIELHPNLVMTHANLADLLYKLGDRATAGRHADIALAQGATSESTNLHLMRILAQMERLGDAERCALLALKANPRSWTTAYQYACLLAAQGKRDAALDAARRIVQMKPDYADGQNLLGSILMTGGNERDAIGPLREAVRLAPQLTEARFNLARSLANLGQNDEAITQLQEVLRAQPGDREALELLESLRGSR